jgi:hypothetical protein
MPISMATVSKNAPSELTAVLIPVDLCRHSPRDRIINTNVWY